eukprot:4171529-Pleurochrysis_carterae.AAC.1
MLAIASGAMMKRSFSCADRGLGGGVGAMPAVPDSCVGLEGMGVADVCDADGVAAGASVGEGSDICDKGCCGACAARHAGRWGINCVDGRVGVANVADLQSMTAWQGLLSSITEMVDGKTVLNGHNCRKLWHLRQ